MDVPEQVAATQGSQVAHETGVNVGAETAWPEVIVAPETEWPAWPSRTDHVTPPFENPGCERGKQKEKLILKGGKGKTKKGTTCKGGGGRTSSAQTPPTNYLGPNLHGLAKPCEVPQVKSVVGGVQISSASFTKGGNFIVTQGALTKAREMAAKNVGAEGAVQDSSEGEGSKAGGNEQVDADKVTKA
uniref:Uncharacterized protein n=1 Tax=Daucus carota subsp. sativus TaxID=79200 RepID=A0A175YP84_DAUCS